VPSAGVESLAFLGVHESCLFTARVVSSLFSGR
jgi:hypothetical protein